MDGITSKINVFEALLACNQKYPNLTKEQRIAKLTKRFPGNDAVFTYFDMPREDLQKLLSELLKKENLIREKELKLMGSTAGDNLKTVTLIYPSVSDKDKIMTCKMTFSDKDEYVNYCRSNNGWIRKRDEESNEDKYLSYAEIVNGGVYAFGGEYFRATTEDRQHRQVDSKVFEHETALAVQAEVGNGDNNVTHIHENVVFVVEGKKREIDGIVVHKGGTGIPGSIAYVIEAQISPPLSKVDKLIDKVELFQKYIPSSPHFNTVTQVIPILAGKIWSKDLTNACVERKIWRVTPSGRGFKIIRSFHTLLIKLGK